jgi:hypothetical protein
MKEGSNPARGYVYRAYIENYIKYIPGLTTLAKNRET